VQNGHEGFGIMCGKAELNGIRYLLTLCCLTLGSPFSALLRNFSCLLLVPVGCTSASSAFDPEDRPSTNGEMNEVQSLNPAYRGIL
jgi:hypothetical protein